MRQGALGCLFAMLLVAVGCGGSSNSGTCDTLTKGLTDFNTKAAPCGGGGTIPSGLANSCTQSLNNSNCSSADKQKFNDFGSCLSALPTCSPATVAAFDTAVSNCVNILSGISPSC